MNTLTLKILFTFGLIGSTIIRMPYQREIKNNTIIDNRKTPQEQIILFIVFLGMVFLPFMYVFSSWLSFADYEPFLWVNGLGIVTFTIALWLFKKAHNGLGKNWSPTLEIREGHTLVTSGVYQVVRHPMYSSAFLWCIAQALLLPNWIAGLAGLISFAIAYFTRIPKEEQMLLDQFGNDYKAYQEQTKQLIPYLF